MIDTRTKITAIARIPGSAINGARVTLWTGSRRAADKAILRVRDSYSAYYHSFLIEAPPAVNDSARNGR